MAMNVKKELQSVKKSIETLSKKLEEMAAASVPEKAKPVKKAGGKKPTAKKTEKLSASETVLAIIKRSRNKKGVAIGTLKEKSGFQGQKLNNILYELKKQGKVKNPSKGVYVIQGRKSV